MHFGARFLSLCHPDRSGGTPDPFLSFGSFDGGSRCVCHGKEQNLFARSRNSD
jgi:hypothetical protein